MADEPLPRPAKEGLDALMAKFRASIPRVAARGRDHEKDIARLREIETALRNQYHTYFSSIGAFQLARPLAPKPWISSTAGPLPPSR